MSSVRRSSPRRGGTASNDLRARPGQADASVSSDGFGLLLQGGEKRAREEKRAMKGEKRRHRRRR